MGERILPGEPLSRKTNSLKGSDQCPPGDLRREKN